MDLFRTAGLSDQKIRELAFESGFCVRNSGKLNPSDFLYHFCIETLVGTVSYNDIAGRIENETGVSVSRQACHHRMGEKCENFFQKVLATAIASKCPSTIEPTDFIGFKRILVQDSTVIRLPLRLFELFSGVKNAHTSVCNARIQGVYDLLSKQFIQFSIDPYSKNDLLAAYDISAATGDLVLRDRGYFVIPAIQELKLQGVDTISRYKHKTNIYDIESGEEINLLEYLTENRSIDKVVLVGSKEKYEMRIIAVPADEETANTRRMKAKKEQKGRNPSQELLALMSWTIFITTIRSEDLTFEHILKLYGLRWRIENIFRTWKSNFSFNKIHDISAHQVRILLNARLIMITLINHRLFSPLSQFIKKISEKRISMMKFMRYISKNLNVINKIVNIQNITVEKINAIIRYCSYDKRKRKNFEIKFEELIPEINRLIIL